MRRLNLSATGMYCMHCMTSQPPHSMRINSKSKITSSTCTSGFWQQPVGYCILQQHESGW
jgi:hypothetical protein